jgi:ABC-2 type transport system ATP-binding protein
MPQKVSLYTDLSVLDNMKLFGSLYGLAKKDLAQRMDELVELLDMSEYTGRITGDIPWGWQQKLSLACANLHKPEILFLDEPTGSVDPVSRKQFWSIITALSGTGTTVFVTTHHMDEAEYCKRVSLMVDGRIAEEGSPRGLREQFKCSTLHEVFLKVASGIHERGQTSLPEAGSP